MIASISFLLFFLRVHYDGDDHTFLPRFFFIEAQPFSPSISHVYVCVCSFVSIGFLSIGMNLSGSMYLSTLFDAKFLLSEFDSASSGLGPLVPSGAIVILSVDLKRISSACYVESWEFLLFFVGFCSGSCTYSI